jgi:hypothetical protein
VRSLQAALGAEACALAWAEGRDLSHEQVYGEALTVDSA